MIPRGQKRENAYCVAKLRILAHEVSLGKKKTGGRVWETFIVAGSSPRNGPGPKFRVLPFPKKNYLGENSPRVNYPKIAKKKNWKKRPGGKKGGFW